MKKISWIIAAALFVWPAMAAAELKIALQNRWPYAAAKAIATSEFTVFLGDGNIVNVYNKSLGTPLQIPIDTSEGITGMAFTKVDAATSYLMVTSGHKGLFRIPIDSTTGTPTALPTQLEIKGQAYNGDDNTLIYPRTRGVAVAGNRAYVAYTKIIPNTYAVTGVEVAAIDPLASLGAIDVPQGVITFTEARGMAIVNNAGFVPDVINGLIGFSVNETDPDTPVDYSWVLQLTSLDITASGNYVYVAGGQLGLQITDVSDPADPAAVPFFGGTDTFYNYNDPAVTASRSIQIADNTVYIADSSDGDGLKVIDVSAIDAPTVTGTFNTNIRGAYSVAHDPYDANFVYLADYQSSLTKIDVSDPAAPAWVTSQNDTPATITAIYMYQEEKTADAGNLYAYALDSRGPMSTPAYPGYREGLRILKFAQTAGLTNTEYDNIQLSAFETTPGNATDIFATEIKKEGDTSWVVYAFLADYSQGLRIYKVTTTGSGDKIVEVTNPDTLLEADLNQAQGVHTADRQTTETKDDITYLFVADGTNGLRAVNVADKTAPTLAGTTPTTGGNGEMPAGAVAKDVIQSGIYAYVAAGAAGLQIVDVRPSEPTYMQVAGSLDTPGDAQGIDILGLYIFIADGSGGVRIIDVSDPAAPAEIASYPATDARAVFARTPVNDQEDGLNPDGKSFAYVADGGGGMLTIDVSDPAAPLKVTEWSTDTPGEATDIAVNVPGSRVILADGTAGLSVHSLSDDEYDPDNDYGTPDIPTADPCFITSVLGR